MKLNYFFLLIVFPILLNAQSFTYQSSTGLNLSGPDTVNLISIVEITNAGTSPFNVLCRISDSAMTAGHTKYFCFGQYCYNPSQSVATSSLFIKPGLSEEFKGYALANNIIGTDDVTYQFYDDAGKSDTLTFIVHYDFSLTGIADINKSAYQLASASPNPARNMTAINYQYSRGKDARLVIYNLLGSPVKEIKLHGNQGIAMVEVSQFAAGVYIYSLVVDGNNVASKKLVVVH